MPGYYLLRTLTWFIGKIPLRALYAISDLLSAFIYHIVRYRRDVVNENLANSFPEKPKRERDLIARKFYSHFCDMFLETLYFDRMSVEMGRKRVKYINPELPNSYQAQGRNIVCLMGHYNNWEWYCSYALFTDHRFYPVYKKLKSKSVDRFYYNLRSRFGAIPIERADTYKQLYNDHQQKVPNGAAFLFDQTPRVNELHHWVNFLNQDTPVVLGPEKVAQKLDSVVLFLNSKKVKRGYYEVEFQLITDHGKTSPKYGITDKCMVLLEDSIKKHPEFWLWSHKRWKHSHLSDRS